MTFIIHWCYRIGAVDNNLHPVEIKDRQSFGEAHLSDLVRSCAVDRTAFIDRLRLMAEHPHCLLVVTSALSQVKSPYSHSRINPNGITQSLIAALAGLRLPFVCSETHELGEELVASYLYQIHLYHWLESHDHGRFLADDDL